MIHDNGHNGLVYGDLWSGGRMFNEIGALDVAGDNVALSSSFEGGWNSRGQIKFISFRTGRP